MTAHPPSTMQSGGLRTRMCATRGGVGQRKTYQIDILVEVVTINGEVRARGGSALSEIQ